MSACKGTVMVVSLGVVVAGGAAAAFLFQADLVLSIALHVNDFIIRIIAGEIFAVIGVIDRLGDVQVFPYPYIHTYLTVTI